MTTNTNAALVADAQINAIACALAELDGYDPKDQNCGLYDLRWSGGPNPEPEGDAWHMDYLPKAEKIASALTTAAAVPLEGFVMVPVELAERVQESLGEFLMDHGWSQRDMDTSDDFGAVLLAAAPKAAPQPAVQQGAPVAWRSWDSENSRWNFTLWPDEWAGHADVWEPLYTYPAAPVAQGDALTYEQQWAIRQGHEIAASDSYFDARPQIDNNDRRKVFEAGFERGWDAARSQAKKGGAW